MPISKDNRQVCPRCNRYMVLTETGIHWDQDYYVCSCGFSRIISATARYDLVKHKELEVKDGEK